MASEVTLFVDNDKEMLLTVFVHSTLEMWCFLHSTNYSNTQIIHLTVANITFQESCSWSLEVSLRTMPLANLSHENFRDIINQG